MAKILIIEPDQGVSEILADYLLQKKHTVIIVQNAKTALEKLHQTDSAFNLVITANRLTDMLGSRLIGIIKKDFPDIHIFFISGYWWEGSLPKGTDQFFSKPFNVEEIGIAVEKITS